jgi:CheY-like chemotaxis protein
MADYLPVRKAFLESQGYQVFIAPSGREGLEILGRNKIDAVVLDYRMPEMNGAEVASEIRRAWPGLPIILLTGFPGEIAPAVHAIVNAVVLKGQGPLVLLESIEAALPEKVLEPRTETPTPNSVELTRKRVQHMREPIQGRRKRINRRKRTS